MSQKAPNFSETEKLVLLELIKEYRHILDSKKNNSVMLKKKELTWTILTDAFNSATKGTRREAKHLKQLWKNMKAKSRRHAYVGNEELTEEESDTISQKLQCMLAQQHYENADNHFQTDITVKEDTGNELMHSEDEYVQDETSLFRLHAPSQPSTSSTAQPMNHFQSDREGTSSSSPMTAHASPDSPLTLNIKLFESTRNRKPTVDQDSDPTKYRLLLMAEEEHRKKMRILKLKEELLLMKIARFKNSSDSNKS